MDAAASGDTILLADGTFQGTGNYALNMNGKDLVLRSQSGDASLCIIDPQVLGRALSIGSGETVDCRIEAITIRNGKAPPGPGQGGAIYCFNGSAATLRECRFEANRIPTSSVYLIQSGGALGVGVGAHLSLEECVFVNNRAHDGGAIGCVGASLDLMDCEFFDNRNLNDGNGAAISATEGSSLILTGCVFDSCTAGRAGGAIRLSEATATIVDCMFTKNSTSSTNDVSWGGAIYIFSTAVFIDDCDFEFNTTALLGDSSGIFEGRGGAVYQKDSEVEIRNSRFLGNESDAGGALYMNQNTPEVLVRGCYFESNHAQRRGGAVFADVDIPMIDSCRFIGNSAELYGGAIFGKSFGTSNGGAEITRSLFAGNGAAEQGGAIACWATDSSQTANTTSLSECTLVGNTASEGSAIHQQPGSALDIETSIIFGNTGSEAVYCDSGAVPTIQCSDVFGNPGGDWVSCIAAQANMNGNISEDPLFCDSANGDYALDDMSPAWLAACGAMGAFDAACSFATEVAGAGDDAADAIPALPTLAVAPNPFNPSTTISLGVPRRAQVRVAVHDLAGREVVVLLDRALASGTHNVVWRGHDASGSPVASGVYFVRTAIGDAGETRKITMVR